MNVNIDEVEKVALLLLSELRGSNGSNVEISNDYYWDIEDEELYNPYEKPKDLALGQLSFDLDSIQRLVKSDNAIAYDLKRLACILRALSVEADF